MSSMTRRPGDAAPAAESEIAAAVGPFKAVKRWKDLLADRTFKSDLVAYGADGMVMDTRDGKLSTAGEFLDFGPNFAYESEFKILEDYGRGWFHGLTWGVNAEHSQFTAVIAREGVITVTQKAATAQNLTDVADFDMPPMTRDAWHRLGVVVRGPVVEIWFDGKSVLNWTDPSGVAFKGDTGTYHQRCKSVRRVFRLGKLD